MTFVLHPLSHYNTITEARARFLLSLIEDLSIDFPSHIILSLIDVYKNTAIRDKLIFLLAITRLLRHFSVSYPRSPHFTFMCAIDIATIKQSIAQFCLRQSQTETTAPPASIAPSTFAPLSSTGGVTLEAIMAQIMCMNTRLDTHSDELCRVNTHIGCIAQRQAIMGGFTVASSPSFEASEDKSDDGYSSDDADKDDDDGSPSDDEMST